MTQDMAGKEIKLGDLVICALVRDRTARMKVGIVTNVLPNDRLTVDGFERNRRGEWGGAWSSRQSTKGTISYASTKAIVIHDGIAETLLPDRLLRNLYKLRD